MADYTGQEAYYVTDGASSRVLHEASCTVAGYKQCLMIAASLAQLPDTHTNGLIIERRMPDASIKQIIRITAP